MKRKRIFIVIDVLLTLAVLFWCGIALYNRINVRNPIHNASGMTVSVITSSYGQESKTLNVPLAPEDIAYFELSDRAYNADYLPRLSQDFSTGGETQTTVWLVYTDGQAITETLIFYENGLCQINGKTAYVFPRGDSAKNMYQKLLKIAQQAGETAG